VNPGGGQCDLGSLTGVAKARQILVSELALAEGTDEERAEILLDEVLATAS
jgi:CarD family transcriptional regulator